MILDLFFFFLKPQKGLQEKTIRLESFICDIEKQENQIKERNAMVTEKEYKMEMNVKEISKLTERLEHREKEVMETLTHVALKEDGLVLLEKELNEKELKISKTMNAVELKFQTLEESTKMEYEKIKFEKSILEKNENEMLNTRKKSEQDVFKMETTMEEMKETMNGLKNQKIILEEEISILNIQKTNTNVEIVHETKILTKETNAEIERLKVLLEEIERKEIKNQEFKIQTEKSIRDQKIIMEKEQQQLEIRQLEFTAEKEKEEKRNKERKIEQEKWMHVKEISLEKQQHQLDDLQKKFKEEKEQEKTKVLLQEKNLEQKFQNIAQKEQEHLQNLQEYNRNQLELKEKENNFNVEQEKFNILQSSPRATERKQPREDIVSLNHVNSDEYQALVASMEMLTSSNVSLKQEITVLKSFNETMTTELTSNRTQHSMITHQLNDMHSKHSEHINVLKQTRLDLQHSNTANDSLMQVNANLELQLLNTKTSIDTNKENMNDTLQQLKQDIEIVHQTLNEKKMECNQLFTQFQELKNKKTNNFNKETNVKQNELKEAETAIRIALERVHERELHLTEAEDRMTLETSKHRERVSTHQTFVDRLQYEMDERLTSSRILLENETNDREIQILHNLTEERKRMEEGVKIEMANELERRTITIENNLRFQLNEEKNQFQEQTNGVVQEEKRKLQIEMEKLKTAIQIENDLKKEEFATKEIHLERKTMELSLKQKNVLDKEQEITLLQNEYQQNKVLLKNEQEHVEQSKEKIHSESRALATREYLSERERASRIWKAL